MSDSRDRKRASTGPVGERLDPAGGVPDDGEARNWDGQTRREFLEMLQENHHGGNVQIDDGFWLVEEDAIIEIGAEAVARRRAGMEAYLEQAWAALEGTGEA